MTDTVTGEGPGQDRLTPSGQMRTKGMAREPALFFSAYVHKHLPGFVEEDPRLAILEQVDQFAETYGLQPVGETWPYERATDMDLVALHRSSLTYQRLVNLRREDPGEESAARTLYQCLIYAHLDALIIQVLIGKFDPWAGSLSDGWRELISSLRAGFDGGALERAKHRTFGASVVYWAMADDGIEPTAYADKVHATMQGRALRCTQTDIGPLWQSDRPTFPQAPGVFQDRWVLVTPRSKQAENEANKRYNQVRLDGPPDFAIVALARHKFAFERAQYLEEHEHLERMRQSLERRARWIIETQRYHGERLGELGAHESVEFQQKLTRAANNLADYRHTVGLVKELCRTLYINRHNFLINCPALISAEGAKQVASSERQEEAASAFLATWQENHQEGIFRSELGLMQGLCEQLDADIDYSELLIERHVASLRSGSEQLQIAGERMLGELSRSSDVDTAFVVASLAVLLVLQLLQISGTLEQRPVFSANLMLLTVTGSFALVLMLSGRRWAKSWLQRGSFAAAMGFLAGSLVALGWDASPFAFAWVNTTAFVVGALVGGLAHWLVELRSLRRRLRRRQRKVEVMATLDKLIYAAEELPELLEDLPPATAYRLKEEASLLTKIERKNALEAVRRGISVEELRELGQDYRMTDVGDVIGIRYVVSPWQVADVVDRIRAVTHPVAIEYKNVTTALGRKTERAKGRMVKIDDPNYRGKYRGFRLNYKSIHIDADLWGVGACKDVNLMAEIQVRTPIQNLFANWFYDIMLETAGDERDSSARGRLARFSPLWPFRRMVHSARRASARGGTAPWLVRFFDLWCPWLNRPLARIVIWLSDLELRLFRGLMDWDAQ